MLTASFTLQKDAHVVQQHGRKEGNYKKEDMSPLSYNKNSFGFSDYQNFLTSPRSTTVIFSPDFLLLKSR